jgi:hypothetical protein
MYPVPQRGRPVSAHARRWWSVRTGRNTDLAQFRWDRAWHCFDGGTTPEMALIERRVHFAERLNGLRAAPQAPTRSNAAPDGFTEEIVASWVGLADGLSGRESPQPSGRSKSICGLISRYTTGDVVAYRVSAMTGSEARLTPDNGSTRCIPELAFYTHCVDTDRNSLAIALQFVYCRVDGIVTLQREGTPTKQLSSRRGGTAK